MGRNVFKVFKTIFLSILFLICVLIGIVTIYLASQYIGDKHRESVASSNAISYIQKKYNFTPNIIEIKRDYAVDEYFPFAFPEANGYFLLKMEYDGKFFGVYVNGKKRTQEAKDDYQEKEILDDVTHFISSEYGIDVLGIDCKYGRANWITSYYDGSNLLDIFANEGMTRLIINTTDCDVQNVDIEDIKETFSSNMANIVDFKSKEIYEETLNYGYRYETQMDSWGQQERDYSILLPYIEEYAYSNINKNAEYGKVYTYETDNLIYATFDECRVNIERHPELNNDDDIDNWQFDNSGFDYLTPKSDVYTIDTDSYCVYIFVPKEVYGDYSSHLDCKCLCKYNDPDEKYGGIKYKNLNDHANQTSYQYFKFEIDTGDSSNGGRMYSDYTFRLALAEDND